ncbi:hypothetical protein [Klebsiella quasipneumoniae]|uniref:hypothetical protein n=1 Tax=Klebsiella quasipneumoniae TaxID=1463165 RepID=UPI0024BDDF05|nr:hypothetical protein [Klebsiella quasipneumoniae]
MTSKLTSEILDDETLAELIAFRRSRVEYCQKEGLPYQKALHDSMMLALEELQERRKVERDTEPYGFTDGDRRGMIYKPEHSDRLTEPVPVYRHAQPVPVVSADLLHTAASAIEDLLTTKDRTGAGMWFDLPFKLRSAANAQPAPEYPEVLPCSVLLGPGLRFGKGIKTSTMLAALARRAVYESDMAALSSEERVEFQARIEDFKALIAQQPVVPDDVLDALQKVARIRLDMNDFDGDRRGIADCLCDAEEALIEVVNRSAAMLAAAPQEVPDEK